VGPNKQNWKMRAQLLLRCGQKLLPTTGLGVGSLLGKFPRNVKENTFDDIAATVG
jgi:hypothetical protein